MTVAGVGDTLGMLPYLDRILLAIVLAITVVAIAIIASSAGEVPSVLEYTAIGLGGALAGSAIPKPPIAER